MFTALMGLTTAWGVTIGAGAWIVLSLIVAGIAKSHGRSFVGWLILSLIIDPVFAGIILYASDGGF